RGLLWLRYRLGSLFDWDQIEDLPIPGTTETTLRGRVPAGLSDGTEQPDLSATSFKALYRTDGEWAAELSNRTVHTVMHLAWIEQGAGRYRGQMGVYVKPRGRAGEGYMALIAPFRRHVVYPALIRQIGRSWNARTN